MMIPRWILISFLTLGVSALVDRIHMEGRMSTVEAAYIDIQHRLDRIEGKVDQLVERGQ